MELLSYGPFISKAQAEAKNAKYYFTGKPCKNGHLSHRFTKHTDCIECCRTQSQRKRRRQGAMPKQRPNNLSYGPFLEREQARAQGCNKYFIGSICIHGHEAPRYVNDGHCIICAADEVKKRRHLKTCVECGKNYTGRPHKKTCSEVCLEAGKRRHKLESRARKRQTPAGRFELNAKQMVLQVIKKTKGWKTGNFKTLVGMTAKEFCCFIQSLLPSHMSFENHGRTGWHLDHVRPCASFPDLAHSKGQQLACFFFGNYQPLWAQDNLTKSDTWTREMEAEWIVLMRSHGFTGELFLVFDHESVAA